MLISKKNRREVYKYLFKGELQRNSEAVPAQLHSRVHRQHGRAAANTLLKLRAKDMVASVAQEQSGECCATRPLCCWS